MFGMDKKEKETRTMFLDILGYSNRNKILECLIEGRELTYSISQISKDSNVNIPSRHKEIDILVNRKVVLKSIYIIRGGKKLRISPIYKISLKNKITKILVKVFDDEIKNKLRTI